MRILVTGTSGQVAKSLAERAGERSGIDLVLAGRPLLDLEADAGRIASVVADIAPALVISAAAYTQVDKAEDEPDLAFAINAEGAGHVAAAAARIGVPVLHLSTDYVFAGDKASPYREDDPTGPRTVYGRSKLAGEKAVANANPRHLILRTAWVYSPFGKNFVKTMLDLARTRAHDPEKCQHFSDKIMRQNKGLEQGADSSSRHHALAELSVVSDQSGNPTSALDIADCLLHIATRRADAIGNGPSVLHLAGRGTTTWSELARATFSLSAALGGPHAVVKDIASEAYPTKAERPRNSALSTERLATEHGWRAPHWRRSLETTVRRLLSEGEIPKS